MTINCIDEMNLYFHMQNHYKKIRSARSIIENFSQNSQNLPSSRSEKLMSVYNCNQRHEKICPILQQQKNKKPSKSRSEPCMSTSFQPKKLKQNKNSEIPIELQFMKKGEKKNTKFKKVWRNEKNGMKETKLPINNDDAINENSNNSDDKENVEGSCASSGISELPIIDDIKCLAEKPAETDKASNSRVEEHEYLQFLLRITEDIIINNYSKSEDIEDVFEHHIEINKERLNKEKMMTQIAGLSSALNITYDKFVPSSEFSQNNLFESVRDSMDYGDFKNCECSVERVLLKKQQLYDCTSAINTLYVNTDDNLNIHKDIENLVREDIKYPSEMDFSCNEEFLDFHENSECYKGDNELISSRGLEKIFPEDVPVAAIASTHSEVNTQNEISGVELPIEIFTQNKNEMESKKIPNQQNGNFGRILKSNETLDNNYVDCPNSKNFKTIRKQQTFVKQSETNNGKESAGNVPVLRYAVEANNVELTDKCTQILINQKDEECDTKIDDLNEIDLDPGYVLINGPLYILKEALSPTRRIVLSQKKHMDIDIAPVKETNLNLSDYSITTENDDLNDPTYSRLLHSDYDLTPQKEESFNKYHYLMVDAYTSISNENIRGRHDNCLSTSVSTSDYQICVIQENNRDLHHENKKLCTFDKENQHLLAENEEYLLQTVGFSPESSLLERNRSENFSNICVETEESENSTIFPLERKRTKSNHQTRILSAPTNFLDNYRIKENNCNDSSSGNQSVIYLRRHKSLQ